MYIHTYIHVVCISFRGCCCFFCGENKFKVCFIFFLQLSVLISRTHMLHCRPVLSTSSQQVDRGNALIVGKARLVKVRQDGRLNLKDVPQRHVRKGGCLLSDAALSTHRAERRRSAGARLLVCCHTCCSFLTNCCSLTSCEFLRPPRAK